MRRKPGCAEAHQEELAYMQKRGIWSEVRWNSRALIGLGRTCVGSSSQLQISEESQNRISQYARMQQQQVAEMKRINQIGEEDEEDESLDAPMTSRA